MTVNYARSPEWHKEVPRLTEGAGADLVIEVGSSSPLVKNMKYTQRGKIVSVVGCLNKKDPRQLEELVPVIIDRKVVVK